MKHGKHQDFEAIYDHENGPQANRRGINSVETGISVLDAVIAMNQPATLKEIVAATKLDASQAHRYLSSLVNSGLLRQQSESGLYDLGPKALKLGVASLSRLEPISVISQAVEKLSLQCGHTSMFSIWGSNGPVIIRWFPGNPPVYTTLSVGSVMSVSGSATGRVFMSFMKDTYLNPHLEAEGWKTPLNKNEQLSTIRQEVLSSAIANVDDSYVPGLRAYAGPVFGVQQSLLGVITLVGSGAIPRSEDKIMHKNLGFICKQLTDELGGIWPFDAI